MNEDQAAPHKFAFGRNWARYARHVTPIEIGKATDDLKQLVGPYGINGRTFLDIGCGSGIHSLAALNSGAVHVSAVDVDENSISTTRNLLQGKAAADSYDIGKLDILSAAETLGGKKYDIVYSWGVLHHTGNMWQAIDNAIGFVAPGGEFIIAIYRKTPLCGPWKAEKAFYSRLHPVLCFPFTLIYAALYLLGIALIGKNPYRYVKDYRNSRGMNFWYDCVDWLGGYPYESATPDEIRKFVEGRGLSLISEYNTRATRFAGLFGAGCAEYVFARQAK
jgi:2-polyprenyl-3-methyl-5-hydroxy-6-metoxy-1,4-benzoquinol methylase